MIESRIRAKKERITAHHDRQVDSAVIRCNDCGRSYKSAQKFCVCGNSLDTAIIIIHYRRPSNGTRENN